MGSAAALSVAASCHGVTPPPLTRDGNPMAEFAVSNNPLNYMRSPSMSRNLVNELTATERHGKDVGGVLIPGDVAHLARPAR